MNKKDGFSRIMAIVTLIILALCILCTLVLAFMGSVYFMPSLMVTLLLPVLLWICMFFYKGMKDRSNEA